MASRKQVSPHNTGTDPQTDQPTASTSSVLKVEATPQRRQSDTILRRTSGLVDATQERDKLRKWAADVQGAPPPLLEPCDPTPPDVVVRSATLGRRSRTRSRSPSVAAGGRDIEALFDRRRSLFTPTATSMQPGASVGLPSTSSSSSARLLAMAAKPMPNSDPSERLEPLVRLSASSPLGSGGQGLAQRRMESGQLDTSLLEKVQSVQISNHSTRSPKASLKQPATARPSDALLRSQSKLSTQSELTPRPEDFAGLPALTSNDAPRGRTNREDPSKSDGGSALMLSMTVATDGDQPPNGLELSGQAHHESPISTFLKTARRGSHSSYPSDSFSPPAEDDQTTMTVPPLSSSTLKDVGQIKGLTPPVASEQTTLSVVSTGLHYGLGASMATSALSSNSRAGTLGIGHYTEPRTSSINALRQASVDLDTPPMPEIDSPTDPHRTREVSFAESRSDQAADTDRYRKIVNAENELSRRKTTGADSVKLRRDGSRHTRTGTADDAKSSLSTTRLSPTAESLTANIKTASIHDKPPQAEHLDYWPPGGVNVGGEERRLSGFSTGPDDSTTSSWDSRQMRGHARTGSLQTPSLSTRAMPSPDVQASHHEPIWSLPGGQFQSSGHLTAEERVERAKEIQLKEEAHGGQASFGNDGGLMGSTVGGHFGSGIRAKVIEVLGPLISTVPLEGSVGETIHLAEFGCLNSRSVPLMQLIISKFAHRLDHLHRNNALPSVAEDDDGQDFASQVSSAPPSAAYLHRQHLTATQSPFQFCVYHEDSPSADFRLISQSLDSRSDSYLEPHWQISHEPSLHKAIFPLFVGRPFASVIAPPKTMHFGLSLMDLHWTHTPVNHAVPLATCADAELMSFLKSRATEFKTGGILMVALLARSDQASKANVLCTAKGSSSVDSPLEGWKKAQSTNATRDRSSSSALPRSSEPTGSRNTTGSEDIWTTLSNTLAPCIQRLVSCGMLKPDVARHLLQLPLHPRTPKQTKQTLTSLRHLWHVEWSCGLGAQGSTESSSSTTTQGDATATKLPSEPQPLRIGHPAVKAFRAGTLSRVALSEHMVMLFRQLYQHHFRKVLRTEGKLTTGTTEFVLDFLWDALKQKVDDHEGMGMEEVDIEVTMFALRRLP